MAGKPIPVPTSSLEDKILCIPDLEKSASKKLPSGAREFYNSGSTDQTTIRENSSVFSKYRLRPRVLVDVSQCDTSTSIFHSKNGSNASPISFPLCVSPAGLQAMAHPEGELATSRACASRGVNMAISSFANHDISSIRSAGLSVPRSSSTPTHYGPISHAIQMYTMQDRAHQLRIIRAAENAGCTAIFLTADSPVLGVRYSEWRNDFRTPSHLSFPILELDSETIQSRTHDDGFTSFNSDSHSWAREIPWLRSVTGMQIWIKGVLTAEDVLLAVEYGVDGVVVSNHGGRQLDGVVSTLDALPECVEAARGRVRVHVDGGIRSGSDIFKAIALGAECCWVGRPVIWGLAHDGQKGVELMLDTLHAEFKRCMQLCGCKSVKDITKASLGIYRTDGPLARL